MSDLSFQVLFPLSVLSDGMLLWIMVLCKSTRDWMLRQWSYEGKDTSKVFRFLLFTPFSPISLFLNGLVLFASRNVSLSSSPKLDATSCFSPSSAGTAKPFTTFWLWFKSAEAVSSKSEAFSNWLLSTSHISGVAFTLLAGTGVVPHSSHILWLPSVLPMTVSMGLSEVENVAPVLQQHDKNKSETLQVKSIPQCTPKALQNTGCCQNPTENLPRRFGCYFSKSVWELPPVFTQCGDSIWTARVCTNSLSLLPKINFAFLNKSSREPD